ncbi:MAG: hypothetical protein EP330_16505 [Deltaproteobacteria bacterium]|nr:MAG: hypothetical protein EP330_16505 [Deltaproteobacteria bacterium]
MRILPLLFLAACGASPGELYWLTVDGASAEIGAACVATPVHDTHALATLWQGDERLLDVDGRVYVGSADSWELEANQVYNSGAGFEGSLSLTEQGGTLTGDLRVDDTTVSGSTCSTSTPVTLRPVKRELGTWQLSGNAGDGTIEPDGCRGSLGDAPFQLVAQAWELDDGTVGAWLSPDPMQRQIRWFAGTGNGSRIDVHWGGAFDQLVDENTMALSIEDEVASLIWQQGTCSLALTMTAEAR